MYNSKKKHRQCYVYGPQTNTFAICCQYTAYLATYFPSSIQSEKDVRVHRYETAPISYNEHCIGQSPPQICLDRLSLLLWQTYANESFLAVRPQFDSDHHQNRSLSSHSNSHESVIFLDYYLLSYGEFAGFFSLHACGYATAAVENNTAGQSIILR